MAYHYNLLTRLYDDVCKDLAEKEGKQDPSHIDQLLAAVNVVETYQEVLREEDNLEDRLIGLIETQQWQRAKQYELCGTVS